MNYPNWNEDDDQELPVIEYKEPEVIKDVYGEANPYCCNTPILELGDINEGNITDLCKTCCHILSNIKCKDDINCTVNEVNNCLSVAASMSSMNIGSDHLIMNICDLFLRSRHELLFEMFLKCCKMILRKSDEKFSDVFEMDSDRTPDYIEQDKFNMKVLIIELAVTSDKGRSLQSKGKIEEGFESKYKDEIETLTSLGYSVYYVTVIFDVKDAMDRSYVSEINNVCDYRNSEKDYLSIDNLEQLRRGFCDIYKRYNKYLHMYMTLLFKKTFEINLISNTLKDYLFIAEEDSGSRTRFKRVTTNPNIYLKAMRSWSRLQENLRFLENSFEIKYFLNYDILTNRMKFVEDSTGMCRFEWDLVFTSNDKSTFFNYTRCTIDNRIVDSKTGKIEYFLTEKQYLNKQPRGKEVYPDDIYIKKTSNNWPNIS